MPYIVVVKPSAMDYILERANRFITKRFGTAPSFQFVIDDARTFLSDIDNTLDKIKFLNTVLLRNNSDYEKHILVCTNPGKCPIDFSYKSIQYYLTQELNRLGVQLDEDTFTAEEKKHGTQSSTKY